MVLNKLLASIFGTKGQRDMKRYWPMVEEVNALEDEVHQRTDDQLRETIQDFRKQYVERKCELFLQYADRVDIDKLYNHSLRDHIQKLRESEGEARTALFQELRPTMGVKELRGGDASDVLDDLHNDFVRDKRSILRDFLPETFAVVREMSQRVLGMRHFDVQILGGIVLFEGKIAEMATGEGKTLVATLPLTLIGLSGEGGHLVTVNDYLASFHAEWMGRLYNALGLSVGAIYNDMPMEDKHKAYSCDITYGTNNEFGFDYLRDHMAQHPEYCFQRGLNYCIVDEIDSILIDEARTPLIISGPADQNPEDYYSVDAAVRRLIGTGGSMNDLADGEEPPDDWAYVYDEKDHTCYLTDKGLGRVQKALGLENMYAEENLRLVHYVNQSLRAHTLYEKDVDYVVQEGEIVIVDEFTGRLMPGRRWSDGLHQAVEAKENLQIQRENQTLATITLQNYFRLYDTLAGMTGTAETEAQEFHEIYSLDVVVIPTNKPCARTELADLIFRTEDEKFGAVVDEIAELKELGRPVLVGTISIEDSERLSGMLKKRGVKHKVLNAKQHESEAEIVAQAGRSGAVTIATNMAGRGTDILLGGNPDLLIDELLKDPAQATDEERAAARQRASEICKEDNKKVLELGGLHVLGTQRHESRRIDNQLRGRCARQGDPGSAQFFLSLDDELLRLFGGGRIKNVASRLGMQEGEVIEHRWVTKSVRRAQKKIETRHFESRKHVLKYDDVMNKQRMIIYELRDRLMSGEDPAEEFMQMREDVVDAIVDEATGGSNVRRDEWNEERLRQEFHQIFGVDEIPSPEEHDEAEKLREAMQAYAKELNDKRRQMFDDTEYESAVLRWILLRRIDAKWKEHLFSMDHLREALAWSANDPRYVQGHPEIAYQQEGFKMFEEMYGSLKQDVVMDFFHVEILTPEEREARLAAMEEQRQRMQQRMAARARRQKAQAAKAGAAEGEATQSGGGNTMVQEQTKQAPRRVGKKTRPNDPCPCGSGKKFKKCCGARR